MRLLLIGALVLMAGCAPKAYEIQLGVQPSELAHYVISEHSSSGRMRVYDCVSRPDGRTWNPTCVRVEMVDAPPKVAGP